MPTDESEPVTTPPPDAPAGDTTAPAPVAKARRWSFGLIAVAVLRLADALNLALNALQLGGFGGTLPRISDVGFTRAIELGLAISIVVGVVGLLGRTRWGWVLTMLIVGFGLVFDLIQYSTGNPVPVSLTLHVLATFYLNQRSVRVMTGDAIQENDDGAAVTDKTEDLDLLHRFEPVVHYTDGEHFFPMDAARYVAACDLLRVRVGARPEVAVPAGELTLERLGEEVPVAGEERYLRFVPEPMDPVDLARWNRRPERPRFRAAGRLARVGLFARLVDAGFTASLLVRGSVPGGTAAAASQRYESIRLADPRVIYHARVIRRDGWIVLHYLFIYAMNDWRSSFFGANDHEADLEQAYVVLEDAPASAGDPIPRWFGCAAHDYVGDDLRRRWDDPTLHFVDDHPVIFAGAGSHASYFERGEYVTQVPLPALRPVRGLLAAFRAFWRDTLRQDDPGDLAAGLEGALSIPFVDYARGDGLAVGPGGDIGWTAILIDDSMGWVDGFRGLWGLDTRDRFAGERAPAGPKYTRNGTARQSWNDPLGFLGLDKFPPPGRMPAVLEQRIVDLEAERAEGRVTAEAKASDLRRQAAAIPVRSAEVAEATGPTKDELALRVAEEELAAMRAADATVGDRIEDAQRELALVRRGDLGDPRAHLRHDQRPQPESEDRYGRVVEFWSAISAGALLIFIVVVLYLGLMPAWAAILIAIAGYVAIEAAIRRRLIEVALSATSVLAAVGAVILLISYLPLVLVLAIGGVATLAILDNVRELRG